MKSRSTVRNWIEYGIALGVLKSLEYSPRAVAERLARAYVNALDRSTPRLRETGIRNLALAFPEKTGSERAAIADGVFRSIGRLIFSFARFRRIGRTNVSDWVRFEGIEYVEAGLRAGRGILFATAHLGNWELSAFAYGLVRAPMSVIVRPLDNPLIDRMVARRRALSGNRIIDKQDFARAILKALQANEAVGILIDQNASLDQGTFVDFFGVPACSGTGFAKLAARSGAAVIPGFALWLEAERRYVLRFYPPVRITGCAEDDTQILHQRLEEVIRVYPDQWLWIHRRWKTRPPGAAPIY